MTPSITWERLREPYLHGERGALGDRCVEVVRVEEGVWSVYGSIGGRTIKATAGDLTRLTYAEAKERATAILRSKENPETW